MRRLALLVPALLLPLACEDESSSSSGGLFNPEAGPGIEAGPLPLHDAGVDAFVPPVVPKGVTLTVLDDGVPKNDVRVILQDAAGLVIGDVKTDATGKVSIASPPAMVTVLTSRGPSSPLPVTFAGVADGDNLVVTLSTNVQVEPSPVGFYSVPLTAGPLTADASDYVVNAGGDCYGYGTDVGTPVGVSLYPKCLGAQNAVLARASGSSANTLGFGFAKNVAKPAAGATVNVPSMVFAAPGQTKLTAPSFPVAFTPNAQLFAIANGAAFPATAQFGTLDDGGVTFSTATGFAEAYQSIVSAESQQLGQRRYTGFLRREVTNAPASLTLPSFDFATALPLINDVALVNPTPARPDVTLTPAASLATSDGGVVSLNWFIDVTESYGSWTFVVPPSTVAFKVPALPADAGAFLPATNVVIAEVTFFEATHLPSYKELKALPITPRFGIRLLDEANKPLPAAGTVRATRWRSVNQRG